MSVRWRVAMQQALYGPDGFFVQPGSGPSRHFRTSVHASRLFVAAIVRLLERIDQVLGRPPVLDVVDVGAGRGELLGALSAVVPDNLSTRVRLTAVELAPRPDGLPAHIGWTATPPHASVGLLIATEWLDNIALDVVTGDPPRYLLADGAIGPPVSPQDSQWLRTWWPLPDVADARAEIGDPRDTAWATAVSTMELGLAVAVDYGHLRDSRPLFGTLTGYRNGRMVTPIADGSCDLTAHVALDSVAAAGAAVAGVPAVLRTQREMLRALGVNRRRPPISAAHADPVGYVRALADASEAAELTDPAGLGGHWWLLQPAGPADLARRLTHPG
jgi:SAM-dependent MidA family methyltransferase